MSITLGSRIFTRINRPTQELIWSFKDIPSSNIGDVANRLFSTNGTLHALNGHPLLGCAFTVKVPVGDNLLIHAAIDIAEPGDIIVVDGGGDNNRALMGEMMISLAQARGIAGVVVNGAVRDLDFCRRADIPIYATGITPQGPYKNGPGEINTPICCAGQVVFPGDILVGDQDGVVVVHEEAQELAVLAKNKMRSEETQRISTKDGTNILYHKESIAKAIAMHNIPTFNQIYGRGEWEEKK